MLGDRNSLAALHRIKGVKEETVGEWLERAAAHVQQFEEHIVRARKLKRVQLDALWTDGGHIGEKEVERKKRKEERFGVGQPLTGTRVYGSDEQ